MAFDKTKLEVLHRGTVGGMALANYDTATPNHGRGGNTTQPADTDYIPTSTADTITGADSITGNNFFPASEVPNGGLVVFVTARTGGTAGSSTTRSSGVIRVYHSADANVETKGVDLGSAALST